MWLQIAIGIVVGFLALFWILGINKPSEYDPNNLGYDSENSGLWMLIVPPLLGALIFNWLGFFLGSVLSVIIFIMTAFDSKNDEAKKTKNFGIGDIKTALKSNLLNWIFLFVLGSLGLVFLFCSFIFEGSLFLTIFAFIFLIPCFFIVKKK